VAWLANGDAKTLFPPSPNCQGHEVPLAQIDTASKWLYHFFRFWSWLRTPLLVRYTAAPSTAPDAKSAKAVPVIAKRIGILIPPFKLGCQCDSFHDAQDRQRRYKAEKGCRTHFKASSLSFITTARFYPANACSLAERLQRPARQEAA